MWVSCSQDYEHIVDSKYHGCDEKDKQENNCKPLYRNRLMTIQIHRQSQQRHCRENRADNIICFHIPDIKIELPDSNPVLNRSEHRVSLFDTESLEECVEVAD